MFCVWKFYDVGSLFCILYSSKIVKEYINSISTAMRQPARYYVKNNNNKKTKHESNSSIGVKKWGSIPVLGYIFIQYFQKDAQETDNFGCV